MRGSNGQNDELANLRPVRETTVILPERPSKPDDVLAVCLATDDPKLLIQMKIYRIGIRGEYARVIDEEGEVAIYPLSNFLILPLPKEMAQRLEIITERHRNCSVHKLLTAKMLSDGLFLSKLGDGES